MKTQEVKQITGPTPHRWEHFYVPCEGGMRWIYLDNKEMRLLTKKDYENRSKKYQCRNCGSLMDDERSIGLGKCYTCRQSFYVRDELVKIFGPPRVPDMSDSVTKKNVMEFCKQILTKND